MTVHEFDRLLKVAARGSLGVVAESLGSTGEVKDRLLRADVCWLYLALSSSNRTRNRTLCLCCFEPRDGQLFGRYSQRVGVDDIWSRALQSIARIT